MPVNVRNLAWLRGLQIDGVPDAGARLHEIITDLAKGMNTMEQQTNSNMNGNPAPPPALQSMTVTPTSVGHHVSINHEGDYYRGATYHVESADNPHFTNPFPAYTGPAREIDLATGSHKLYFQAFASYPNSGNTTQVYHGGTTPQAVTGGVSTPRPALSRGSGTGKPGQGLSGYGPTPYTGSKPPVRST